MQPAFASHPKVRETTNARPPRHIVALYLQAIPCPVHHAPHLSVEKKPLPRRTLSGRQ